MNPNNYLQSYNSPKLNNQDYNLVHFTKTLDLIIYSGFLLNLMEFDAIQNPVLYFGKIRSDDIFTFKGV